MGRVIFVTGTDTGVGKTAVTALLLTHAQDAGMNVRALKPFWTGEGGDEALLGSLQENGLKINSFNYAEPLSPWSAARIHNSPVTLSEAAVAIREQGAGCELVLVEGAGGLLTPLGERFTAAELIVKLGAEVVVVAANRLGVLNHALLTIEALSTRDVQGLKVALVEQAGADVSRKTNLSDLRELLPGLPIVSIPFLENYAPEAEFIREAAKSLKVELGHLLAADSGKKNPPDTEAEGTFP